MKSSIGEFEQIVLLAVLQLEDDAYALDVRTFLRDRIGRRVTRGALYRTFERLHDKGLLEWQVEKATPERKGHLRRRFRVSPAGVSLLTRSRAVLFELWDGLDRVLGEP